LGNSRISWVALNLALSPCPLAERNLLERFREPGAILSAGAAALAEVPGVTPRLAARLRDPRLLEAAAAELKSAERQSIRILIRDDPEFPRILAQLPDPPPLLYVRGSLRDGDDPAVAVVGSRRTGGRWRRAEGRWRSSARGLIASTPPRAAGSPARLSATAPC